MTDVKKSPVFLSSLSLAQALGVIEKEKRKADGRSLNPVTFIKFRFGKEHLVGSLMGMLSLFSTINLMRSGHKQNDPSREIGGFLATALSIWCFASERGSRLPKGDTVIEKAWDTAKNPSRSSAQFGVLMSLPINFLIIGGNMWKGYKGDSLERSRIIQAALGTSFAILQVSGILNIKSSVDRNTDFSSVKFQNSEHAIKNDNKSPSMLKIFNYAWKYDKQGLVGKLLQFSNAAVTGYEAVRKLHRKVDGAGNLLTNACINMTLSAGNAYYQYALLLKEEKALQVEEPVSKSSAFSH